MKHSDADINRIARHKNRRARFLVWLVANGIVRSQARKELAARLLFGGNKLAARNRARLVDIIVAIDAADRCGCAGAACCGRCDPPPPNGDDAA